MPPQTGYFCAANATASAGWCPAYTGTGRQCDLELPGQRPRRRRDGRDRLHRQPRLGQPQGLAAQQAQHRRRRLRRRAGDHQGLRSTWTATPRSTSTSAPTAGSTSTATRRSAAGSATARARTSPSTATRASARATRSSPADRELPPIFKPGLATNNSNGRFFSQDIRTGGSGNVSWNSTTRVLSMNSNATLTMGGTDYFICRLVMDSNSRLYMAAGAKVRIYFDTPENCGLAANTAQIDMSSNTEVSSTSWNPDARQLRPARLLHVRLAEPSDPGAVQQQRQRDQRVRPLRALHRHRHEQQHDLRRRDRREDACTWTATRRSSRT